MKLQHKPSVQNITWKSSPECAKAYRTTSMVWFGQSIPTWPEFMDHGFKTFKTHGLSQPKSKTDGSGP